MTGHDASPSSRAPEFPGEGVGLLDIYPIETEYGAYVNQMIFYNETRESLLKDLAFMHEIEQKPDSLSAKLFQQNEALYALFSTNFDGFLEWISHEYRHKCRPAAEVIVYLHKCLDEFKKRKADFESNRNVKAAQSMEAMIILLERHMADRIPRFENMQRNWRNTEMKFKPRSEAWASFAGMEAKVMLPGTQPVPKGYQTYVLFLIPSTEWLDREKQEEIGELFVHFKRFGEAIGDRNAAVWFYRGQPAKLDVNRCKNYSDTFGLNYNDGPYVLILASHPDGAQPEPPVVIKLGGVESARIIKVLNAIEQEIRTASEDREIRGLWLSYVEKREIVLGFVEKAPQMLKDVLVGIVVELVKGLAKSK